MFISQLGESVISRDKQIMAGDVAAAIERRSMRRNFLCVLVPLQLHIVRQSAPALERMLMDGSGSHLIRSAGEFADRLYLVEALSVPMIERDIAD